MRYSLVGSRALSRCLFACGALLSTLFAPIVQAQNCSSTTTTACQSTLMFFDGTVPQGGLTLGSDGHLYGTGSESGYSSSSFGLYYRLAPNASGVGTLYEYGRNGEFTGAGPRAGLLLSSDGYFYGVTSYSGWNSLLGHRLGYGTIFRMAQNGSNYAKLYEFDAYAADDRGFAVNTTGTQPVVALTEGQETDGRYLYGTASTGGLNGTGVIFKIRADGQGFKVLHHFGEALRKVDQDSSGNDVLVFDFNPEGRLKNADGLNPGLVASGTETHDSRLTLGNDGRLYGTTAGGGPYGTGVFFSISRDGADFRWMPFDVSPPDILEVPEDPTAPSPNDRKTNVTGAYPLSHLVQASDGYLYGTTSSHGGFAGALGEGGYGGDYGYGTIYRVDPLADPYVIEPVLNFTGGVGAAPGAEARGNLIISHDGKIVGTTAAGGVLDATTAPVTSGFGTVFSYDIATLTYTTLMVFGAGNDGYNYGVRPLNGVIEVPDSGGDYAYYGTTSAGSPYGRGTVFKVGKPTNAQPLGTPVPLDDGGGSIDIGLLVALLVLVAASYRFRRRVVARAALGK